MSAAPLELDFVSPDTYRFSRLRLVLLCIGIAALALAAEANQATTRELASARAGLDELARKHAPVAAGTLSRDPTTDRQMKRASAVLDDLELPWDGLFSAMEAAGSAQLQLLGLAPDAPTHMLRISGEAGSVDEVLAYIQRLAQQPLLEQVHLMSYAAVDRAGSAGVQFTIGAKWKHS